MREPALDRPENSPEFCRRCLVAAQRHDRARRSAEREIGRSGSDWLPEIGSMVRKPAARRMLGLGNVPVLAKRDASV
jgi:hypothetical protein